MFLNFPKFSILLILTFFGISISSNAHIFTSTKEQTRLAKHLKSSGVILYGAKSCPFSSYQRMIFGKSAADLLKFIDCEKKNNKDSLGCKAIEAYPTWFINDTYLKGVKSLEELRSISLYE